MLRNSAVLLVVGVTTAVTHRAIGTTASSTEASKPCTAYAFWTDKGCRTWSTPCTKRVPTSHIETLNIRKPGTSNFTAVAKGQICAGAPDFRDGPAATPTDAACRQRCLSGEHGIHGGGGHHGPSPPPLPKGPVKLTVHTDSTTHQISPLAMGCHSDSGYAHQARGFYSQMIVGSSFNATGFPDGRWNVDPSITVTDDDNVVFYGTPSEEIKLNSAVVPSAAAAAPAGVSNRGLGNAGMVFEAGKVYEGFLFARLPSTSRTTSGHGMAEVPLTVSLEDYVSKKTLASQTLSISTSHTSRNGDGMGSNGFVRYNFTLTPSASTACIDIAPGSDLGISCGNGKPRSSIGHTCVRCGGEFKLSLTTPGSAVLVNYVFLQPGEWGRLAGLPVLKSAADLLKTMGIKAIRQGGSFASSSSDGKAHSPDITYYQWEKWTGDAWSRPSRTNGVWKQCLLSGWGIFEMIDMCNALGIEPVITTTETDTAEEFAALVEYCHGDATTPMGKKRIADGHPEKYDVKYFELGNEQYNPNYVEQVAAMEAKARKLGIGNTIHYMFPQNGFLNDSDLAKAAKLTPRIDELMVADLHVGGGGAVEQATELFAKHPDFKMGAVNAETNAGTHTFDRAMSEASDLNDWFNAGIVSTDAANRLHFRAASFCMGDATDFDAWDQGIAFFLPNATWLQPPGYVHQMIDQTWQPNALNVSATAGGTAIPATTLYSAQKSTDGKTLVLRYVNFASATTPAPATKVTVHLKAKDGSVVETTGAATLWTLESSDGSGANPPGNPTLISPKKSTLPNFQDGTILNVPANAYIIVEAGLA